jgi:hypothetical protein
MPSAFPEEYSRSIGLRAVQSLWYRNAGRLGGVVAAAVLAVRHFVVGDLGEASRLWP